MWISDGADCRGGKASGVASRLLAVEDPAVGEAAADTTMVGFAHARQMVRLSAVVSDRLLISDCRLALCHGHSSSISVHEWNVGLPRATNTDPPSYRSFILLCELTMLLDEALSTLCSVRTFEHDGRRPDWKLATVADLGRRLDAWSAQMDQLVSIVRSTLGPEDTLPPGFRASILGLGGLRKG